MDNKIITKEEYDHYCDRIEELLKISTDVGGFQNESVEQRHELERISHLVADYEEFHYPISFDGFFDKFN